MKDEGYLSNVLDFLPEITKTRSTTEYWIPFSLTDGVFFISLPQSRRMPHGYALSEVLLKNLKGPFQQNSFPHHHNPRLWHFTELQGVNLLLKQKHCNRKPGFLPSLIPFQFSLAANAVSNFAGRSRYNRIANTLSLCAHLSTNCRNAQRWKWHGTSSESKVCAPTLCLCETTLD